MTSGLHVLINRFSRWAAIRRERAAKSFEVRWQNFRHG